MTEPILSSLAQVQQAMSAVEAALGSNPPLEAGLFALAEVRDLERRIGIVEAQLEASAVRTMPTRRVELPRLVAERRSGSRRYSHWDHAGVCTALLKTAQASGAPGPPDARTVLQLVLRTARPAWRTTVLRELDIDVDDYASSSTSPPSVIVHLGSTASTVPDGVSSTPPGNGVAHRSVSSGSAKAEAIHARISQEQRPPDEVAAQLA